MTNIITIISLFVKPRTGLLKIWIDVYFESKNIIGYKYLDGVNVGSTVYVLYDVRCKIRTCCLSVCPTLYKCYKHVLCLLGVHAFTLIFCSGRWRAVLQ